MKKITTFILISLIGLSSCGDANNPEKCLESVKRTFPNSKIYINSDSKFTFLIIDSIGVRRVTTMNISNTDIDSIKEYNLVK